MLEFIAIGNFTNLKRLHFTSFYFKNE